MICASHKMLLNEMSGTCRTYGGGEEKCMERFDEETCRNGTIWKI